MSSAVQICNLALSHLGDSATVASIDPPEGSAQAEHCARFYPVALATLLASHNWAFATTRVTLAQTANPSSAWGYAYAQPSDLVTCIAVQDPDATSDVDAAQPYAREVAADGTTLILTNVEGAVLRYVRSVTDPTKFPPMFSEALAWLLAASLAGPVIKGGPGVEAAQACMRAYTQWLGVATADDANQQDTKPTHTPGWMAAR